MKVDELRELEEDQLGDRMRAARRELYELRFKHAVGQLENSSQIAKVRHDIARIMTVLSERQLGLVSFVPHEGAATAVADKNEGFEADVTSPHREEAARSAGGATHDSGAAEAPQGPKPKRTRKAKTEEAS
jgi:large subunit ribosomal protein L29